MKRMKTFNIGHQDQVGYVLSRAVEGDYIWVSAPKNEHRTIIINDTVAYVGIAPNQNVRVYNCAKVICCSDTTLEANDSVVTADGGALVISRGDSIIYAQGSSSIKAYDRSIVVAKRANGSLSNRIISAMDHSTVFAFEDSRVRACDHATIFAFDNSAVYSADQSVVHIYGQSVIYVRIKDGEEIAWRKIVFDKVSVND